MCRSVASFSRCSHNCCSSFVLRSEFKRLSFSYRYKSGWIINTFLTKVFNQFSNNLIPSLSFPLCLFLLEILCQLSLNISVLGNCTILRLCYAFSESGNCMSILRLRNSCCMQLNPGRCWRWQSCKNSLCTWRKLHQRWAYTQASLCQAQ